MVNNASLETGDPASTRAYRGLFGALFLALLLPGCAATPAPEIPLAYAARAQADALTGQWWGDYGSVQSGRHGRVRFSLEASDEVSATGDVLMIPQRLVGGDPPETTHPGPPTSLRVSFVRIEDGTLVGALEPYNDPGCGCLVSTTFIGRVVDNSIEGTYVSQGGAMHLGHSGRWRVDRRVDVSP